MDAKLLKLLKEQIKEIDNLKQEKAWCSKYKIWEDTTLQTIENLFGVERRTLLAKRLNPLVSYEDETSNQKQYSEILEEARVMLNGFIEEEKRLRKKGLSGIFIATRKMQNDGVISSDSPDARTEIITENYKGKGVVEAKTVEKQTKKNWFSMGNPLVWLLFSGLLVIISYVIPKIISRYLK